MRPLFIGGNEILNCHSILSFNFEALLKINPLDRFFYFGLNTTMINNPLTHVHIDHDKLVYFKDIKNRRPDFIIENSTVSFYLGGLFIITIVDLGQIVTANFDLRPLGINFHANNDGLFTPNETVTERRFENNFTVFNFV